MTEDRGLQVRVRKRLGDLALDVAFETAGHGLTALFGPSGGGKTSVIAAIAGLIRPDEGRIVAAGEVLFDAERGIDVPAEQRRVGYVFQESRLFPHLRVRDNLAYGLRRARGHDRGIALDAVVDLLGIGHLLDRRPLKLSGGEKQRVAIGRALLAQPRLLLMDEPLASLDAARRQEILPYVERLRDELRLLVVYVSHSLPEVLRLANTVVLLEAGRVLAHGSPADLSFRPDVRHLFGGHDAASIFEARVESHDDARALTRLSLGSHTLLLPRIASPSGTRARLRIRARDILLATVPPTHLSVQNALHGTVAGVASDDGIHAEVIVQAGGVRLLAQVTQDSVNRLGLREGVEVYALIKSVAIDSDAITTAPIDLE